MTTLATTRNSIQEIRLPNGLRVVFESWPDTPAVAYHLWVDVGSADEEEGQFGIAHLLEHMLFKGNAERDGMEINEEVEKCGGSINAFTSYDHTAYHLVMPSKNWKSGLDILLALVFQPLFQEDHLELEKQVVLEEIKEGNDLPEMVLGDRFFEKIYHPHPYGRPVIGFADKIREIRVRNLTEFHQKWYTPERMVLAVSGGIQWQELTSFVSDFFSQRKWDFSDAKRPALPKFSAKEGDSLIVQKGSNERILEIAFPIPGIRHADCAGIELLSVVLGGHDLSRLYTILRNEKRLVRSVSSSVFVPRGPGQFLIQALPFEGVEKEIVGEVSRQIKALQDQSVSPLELQRAKSILSKDLIFNDESCDGRARTMAYYQLVFGQSDYYREFLRQVMSTTEEDVQYLARKYLEIGSGQIALLVPEDSKTVSRTEIRSTFQEPTGPSKKHRASQSPHLHDWVLPSGLRIIHQSAATDHISSIYASAKGGLWAEEPSTNGISNLISMMVGRGTQKSSEQSVIDQLIFLQADFSGIAGRNSLGFRMETVGQALGPALQLFGEMLVHPRFEEDALVTEKSAILNELEAQKDYFEVVAGREFSRALFQNHPYGMPLTGDPQVIGRLSSTEIRAHFHTVFQPTNTVVSIVSKNNPFEVEEMTREVFEDFKNTSTRSDPKRNLPPLKEQITIRKPIPGEQAYIVYGFRACSVSSVDRYATDILSALLAGSSSGRLYSKIREELALVYTIDSSVMSGIDSGYLAVSLNTAPDQVSDAVMEIDRELKRLILSGPSEDEFQRVRNYLIGISEIEAQRSGAKATQLALGKLLGTDSTVEEYVRGLLNVSRKELMRVSEEVLRAENSVLVILSPTVN